MTVTFFVVVMAVSVGNGAFKHLIVCYLFADMFYVTHLCRLTDNCISSPIMKASPSTLIFIRYISPTSLI